MAYKPQSYLARFMPATVGGGVSPPATSLSFQTTIETAEYTVTLSFDERDMLTTSADGQVSLLFAGDLYQPQVADIGPALLALYERRGINFVADLNGSFSLLLVDRRADQILIVTDRMNSLKLLASWAGSALTVSNSIYLQPVAGARLDRAALAGYLASGFVYNDRTLFEGVRMLDGASVYRLHDGKLASSKYWHYVFAPSTTPGTLDSLKQEMGDLLVEAVRLRVRTDRPIYLSFSAGFDSRAVLGILANYLHVPDVRCFSYVHGPVRPKTDEWMAAQMAAMVGYRHEMVPSFDGDLVTMLQRNGQLGGGMAAVCDEVDAWLRLGNQVRNGPMPVMFTGDTLSIRGDLRLKSDKDVFTSARMYDFTVLSWLEKRIGGTIYRELVAAGDGELETALRRLPPTDDRYDMREMLRFDQVNSRETETWREYYAGRFFRPAHPILDNGVVDLLLRAPLSIRHGKRLYLATVTAMLPQLFALPHYRTASYRDYWPEALTHQTNALADFVRGQSSPLDDVIAPDVLIALLAADLPSLTRSNAVLGSVLKKAFRLLRRANMHRSDFVRPSMYKRAIPAMVFLQRALVVRSFLAEMTAADRSSAVE